MDDQTQPRKERHEYEFRTSVLEADMRDFFLDACAAEIKRRGLRKIDLHSHLTGRRFYALKYGQYHQFSLKSAMVLAQHLGCAEKTFQKFAEERKRAA